jgi:F-type H+-transporting ATPase subunit gamma
MASLRQIRQRMKAIHNIHGITKAMGMIATFRFKRAENRFSRSRNYFQEMEKMIANLSSAAGEPQDKLFEARKVKRKALVVMTGDKGLCGAYNSNLLKAMNLWLKENEAFQPVIIPVAKVCFETCRKKHVPTLLGYPEKAMADLSLAKKMTEEIKQAYLSGQVDQVDLLYASYKAGTPGRNVQAPFLNLRYLMEKKGESKQQVDYIYEPDLKTVFFALLDRYLEGKMYMAVLESLTSESSARMLAMKQATDNAEDVLDNLKLQRNKTRQASITRELSEIVSGASVLV